NLFMLDHRRSTRAANRPDARFGLRLREPVPAVAHYRLGFADRVLARTDGEHCHGPSGTAGHAASRCIGWGQGAAGASRAVAEGIQWTGPPAERVRPNGGDGRRDDPRSGRGWTGDRVARSADWQADRQRADLHPRPGVESCASWGPRRALY